MKNSDLKRLYGKDNMQNEKGFARLNDKGLIDTPIDSSSIVPPEGTAAGKVMASDGAGKTTWIDNGTEVVANPTLAGTEAALSGLQVGTDKYAVPTPTEVVANPTLAGTEAALTGLQVGDTKYKGITPTYLHVLMWSGVQLTECIVINNSPDNLSTSHNFAKYLYDNGFRSPSNLYPVNTGIYAATGNNIYFNIGVYSLEGSTVRGQGKKVTYENNAFSATDSSTYAGFDPVSDTVIRII